MKKRKRPARVQRSLDEQAEALRARYPEGRAWRGSGRLTWTGPLHPSPLSATYTLEVTYTTGGRPKVTVVDPVIQAPAGKKLPHVFPGDRLCLHFPNEWTKGMLIADTIIPWAAEWLVFYELWQVTGVWHGGGHEPASGVKPQDCDAPAPDTTAPSTSLRGAR